MSFMKRIKKSFLSMSMIVIALAGSTGLVDLLLQSNSSAAEAVNQTPAGPIFSFMSISDIHDNTTNLSKALDDSVANNVSLIAVAGDITNNETDSEYDAVMSMMNSKPHPPVYYTMGNHEYDYENDFKISKNRFLTKTGAPSLNYDKWINGYHFIFLSAEIKPAGYTDETINWLRDTLAVNADPSKPIFLFMHQPLDSTASQTYPTNDYWGLNPQSMYKVKDILANYPQSVFVTGHIHDDVKIEGNLYSDKFSAIRDGAIVNNQGLIFDVYSDKVQIRGRDFNTKSTIWNGTIQLQPNTTGIYEAEEGSFTYATNSDDVNASGGKVVNMKDGRAYLEMLRVDGGASGGQKILKVSYAAAAANASMGVYVNGYKVQTINAPPTGGTGTYGDVDVAVDLKPGPSNKIALKRESNAVEVNLDKLQILEPANYSTMWGFNNDGSDTIPNGFNATLQGNAAFDTANKMEGLASLSLNGADGNYASAGLVSTKTDDVTLTAWVRWNGATSGSQVILANGDGLTNGYSIALDHAQGDKVSIVCNGQTILGSQTALTAGQWTNITAVRRGGTWELTINGINAPITNNTSTPDTPTTGTFIGADSSGKTGFNGLIDSVRVYNQALTIDQIKAIANETSAAKLVSIAITKLPNKLRYWIDDRIDITGMTVTGTYSDGTTKTESITGNNISGFNTSKVQPSQTLTVNVGGKTDTYNIEVFTYSVGTVPVPGWVNAVNIIAKHDFVYMGSMGTGILPANTWVDYSVDVKKTGTYRLNYQTGRYDSGTVNINLLVDGVYQNTTAVPSTGQWGGPNNKTTSTNVALTQGTHTIRLQVSERVVITSFELLDTSQSYRNIAANATVTASTGTSTASKATDGVIEVDGSGEWVSTEVNPWIQLTWPTSQTIDRVILFDRFNWTSNVNAGTLSFSDGTSIAVTGMEWTGLSKEITFPEKSVTWVKFTATGGTGTNNGLSEFQVYFNGAGTPATSINVTGAGGVNAITSQSGTLQMQADVLPVDATFKNVTWSVFEADGVTATNKATIDASGLLAAKNNGTVKVIATSLADGSIQGAADITITGQSIANLATATVSSEFNASYAAKYAIDGIVSSEWASLGEANPWIKLQLDTVYTINKVVLYDRANTGDNMNNGTLSFSDGSSIPVTGIATNGAAKTVIFPDKTVGWVKFQATGNTGAPNNGLAEIQIYGDPAVPVTSIAVNSANGSNVITDPYGTLQMQAAVLPANATKSSVIWSVTEANGVTATNKATIDASGLLTAQNNGTVKVIATAADGTGIQGTATITNSNQPIVLATSITVSGAGGVNTINDLNATLQMQAVVLPANVTNGSVAWGVYEADGVTATDKATINANGLLVTKKYGTVKVVATANDGSGVQGSATIAINDSSQTPIAWWKFDETPGTTVADSSGNGITGTASNNPVWTQGRFGGALEFNMGSTTNQRVEFPSAKFTTEGQTVTMWFKTTEPPGSFVNENLFRHNGRMIFQLSGASGAPRVTYWPSSAGSFIGVPISGWANYKDNKWHHLATTYDKVAGLKIYLDGVQVASNTTNLGPLKTSAVNFVLGAAEGGGENFKGTIDDVRVFGVALDKSQIEKVMGPLSITVSSVSGSASIEQYRGTLQMQASVLPAGANPSVTWSVYDANGISATNKATIDVNGLLTAVDNGAVTVVATAIDGSGVKGAATITISGQNSLPQATLTGLQQVNSGDTFNLTMGLTNVTQSVYQQVYGQDLTLRYDPVSLQFNSVTSLQAGLQIIDQKVIAPGQVRIVAATVGQSVYAQGDLLSFQFTAKSVTQATYMTTISVDNVVIANGQGNELQVSGASHEIQISTPVDKSLLTAMIANAQAKYNAAVEGNGDGLYAIGAKAQLQSAIDAAKAIANDPNAAQQQVDNAKSALEAAILVFETKRINADINGGGVSIGDLAIVAAAYGKAQGQSGWNELADVNKDGMVGLEDLAIVALAMLK